MAAAAGLDLLGIIAVALSAAIGGGILRDLLVGESPPEALRDWRLISVALVGAVLTLLFSHQVTAIPEGPLLFIDALGLSLLAVAAAEKSLEYGVTPIGAALMAAIAGAAVLIIARRAGFRPALAALAGGTTCCVLRLLAIWQGWQLPHF